MKHRLSSIIGNTGIVVSDLLRIVSNPNDRSRPCPEEHTYEYAGTTVERTFETNNNYRATNSTA